MTQNPVPSTHNPTPIIQHPSKLKLKAILFLLWLKNLFTKKGRKDNYFNTALKNIRKTGIKKIMSRRQAKKELIEYVRGLQRGPKKSHWEIYQLCKRKGLKVDAEGNVYSLGLFGQLKDAGVKIDWQKMKFLN